MGRKISPLEYEGEKLVVERITDWHMSLVNMAEWSNIAFRC